tara:strand:+ start:90 stop:1235 length:1146 start_codon:yes stop_codon:yes gene_type:complete
MRKKLKVVEDKGVIGPRTLFGVVPHTREHHPLVEGTLLYWLEKFFDCEAVSLDSKDFLYLVNCPGLSFTGAATSNTMGSYDFSLLEGKDCKIIINDAMEGCSWFPSEVKDFLLYMDMCGIDPDQIMVVVQNYNVAYERFPFKMVHWNFFESFFRERAKEWIDYNDDAKKFLCLNRWPAQHRFYFMYQMQRHGILDQFNWSMGIIESPDTFNYGWNTWTWTDEMSTFANEFTPNIYDNSAIQYQKNLAFGGSPTWDFPEHKRESLLYIVTETAFIDNDHVRDVSEKTWRPISMQMPFILLHQPFALRRLRDIGYKTFHTIWDESYDIIEDPKERMDAIVSLVLELNSRKDFRDMIDSCRDIVEHNFNMLKMRRPEENWISML